MLGNSRDCHRLEPGHSTALGSINRASIGKRPSTQTYEHFAFLVSLSRIAFIYYNTYDARGAICSTELPVSANSNTTR